MFSNRLVQSGSYCFCKLYALAISLREADYLYLYFIRPWLSAFLRVSRQ